VHDNLSGIYAAMASEAYGKALKTDDTTTRPQPRLAMVGLPYAEKQALAMAANTRPTTPAPIKAVAPTLVAKPALAASVPAAPLQTALTPVAAPMAKPAAQPTAFSPKTATETIAENSTIPIEATIKGWAKAWSRQDVDRYLDYYAGNFKPPKGESRRAWEQTRRSRINSPESITVDISNLKIENDGNRAKARFKQNYRADRISKRTNKTLVLNRNGNRWLIVEELAR
jgi:ketosteroid isomerase-like protein